MADEILNRDPNHVVVLGGVTDNAAEETRMLRVDPATGRLLVQASGLPGSGTVTDVSVVTANGFAGTVATSMSTPAITLETTETGILIGNGTSMAGTALSGVATEYFDGTGAFSTPAGTASPLTTKGDIFVYSTMDDRLPVGTDGQILSANSAQATGLEWINNTAGAPTNAEYVVMSLDATLTDERVLTGGAGLTLTDGGANGNATLDVVAVASGGILVNANDLQLDINSLAVSAIAGGDFLAFEDISGGLDKKITWTNLQAAITITESQISDLSHNTLDEAYDEGGAGAGRTITVAAGAVALTVPDTSNNTVLELTNNDTTNDTDYLVFAGTSSGAHIVHASNLLIDAPTTTFGTGGATAVIESSGNFDLTLQTGNATTGVITIKDGANADINITPNGSGGTVFGGNHITVPFAAAPTLNADGELALDTTVTDFTDVLKFYGGEEQGIVSAPVSEFTSPTDGHVWQYDGTADENVLAAAPIPNTAMGLGQSNYVVTQYWFTDPADQSTDVTWTVTGGIVTIFRGTHAEFNLDAGSGNAFCLWENMMFNIDASNDLIWESVIEIEASAGAETEGIAWGMPMDSGSSEWAKASPANLGGRDSANFFLDASGNLFGRTMNDGVETDTAITGVTLTDRNIYRIEWDTVSAECRFYVNDTLEATNTTNLPTSTSTVEHGFGRGGNDAEYNIVFATAPIMQIELR